jgi:pentatricopeptide repeat protein
MIPTNILKTQDNAKTTSHGISDITGKCLDSHTYVYNLLQACVEKKALTEGKLVHAHINERGLMTDRLLGNTIINMYLKCGNLMDARKVFDEMPERNVCSWTMMIAVYARYGFAEEALELFGRMWQTGVQPNQFTFASVLRACAGLEALEYGAEIHGDVIRRGFGSDVVVENALVDMYVKCGCIEIARQVFDKMSERDMVSWTTMIAGYAQVGFLDEALELFGRMSERDVFCWTVMIAAFTQRGLGHKAVELFWQMESTGLRPDAKAFASVLAACADLAALEEGIEIHKQIVR